MFRIYRESDSIDSWLCGDVPSPWTSADSIDGAVAECRADMAANGLNPDDWETVFYIEED
jgi:hypothetical protein